MTNSNAPDDFCRCCLGSGRLLDITDSAENFGMVRCDDCAGTGWRNPSPPAPRRIRSIWDHEIIRTDQ